MTQLHSALFAVTLALSACIWAQVAGAAAVVSEVKLPAYFPEACPRNLPTGKLNECIRTNVQSIIPFFAKGEKRFNLESLDPMPVADVKVSFSRQPFDFQASVRNTRTYGVSGIIIRGVRSRLSEKSMDLELDITIPKLLIEGDVKMEGRFGNFPYSGKGPYNVSFTDLEATWHLIGDAVENKDGVKYMKIKRFIPEYSVSDMKFYAENFVDGAPELTSLAVNLMNQFWKPTLQAMKPATTPELERVMKRISNDVFASIPYDQLFPVLHS